MAYVIDRVQRAAEEGFNKLLDLFGEEITIYDGATTNVIYALIDKPLSNINSLGVDVVDINTTFQFLKSDITLSTIDKVNWDSRDWSLASSFFLNKDDNLGIYTCIGTYSY